MRAGKLDRRITIRRYQVIGHNEFNEEIRDWADVATVWAQQRPNRGSERFAAQQVAGTAVMMFHIRYRDVKVEDVIRYDGKEWNVTDVREVGRRVVTEIDCVARQD